MADHEPLQEIDYESLPGGSLSSNLMAGAFAGIMVGIAASLEEIVVGVGTVC